MLCQFWAERKRRLLVICPASLRKQWAMELEEKFNLPHAGARRQGLPRGATEWTRAFEREGRAHPVHELRERVARGTEEHRLGSRRHRRSPQAAQRLSAEQQGRPGHSLGDRGLPQALAHRHAAAELTARTVWPLDPHRRPPVRRPQLLPLPICQRRQQHQRVCGSVSRASASARCAIRSPSTSATPSGGRSRGRSRRATTSTRSTRRCPGSCSARTATRCPNASAT